MEAIFSFSGALFETPSEVSWVFVSVPAEDSEEIHDLVPRRPGFGSVRVTAEIGETSWKTSIFPSKEYESYVLPVKRAVRDKERIGVGDVADVSIRIAVEL